MTDVPEKERADQAFQIIIKAVNEAMSGQFPTGINALEYHMQVKGAIQYLGDTLGHYFEPANEEAATKPCVDCEDPVMVEDN